MAAAFRTIAGDTPLRAVVVGAGGMGRGWIRAVGESPLVELVGIVDLDLPAAQAAADGAAGAVAAGTSLSTVAAETGAEIVVDVTVPRAHHPITTEALHLGLPVLGEKPLAATMAESLSLLKEAETTGQLFMVSQNRRFIEHLFAYRDQVRALGGAEILTHEFFKAPHFGGFRDEMAHPLLLDMAIHNFDAARFLLGADPVAVYCDTHNPSWSWYDGDAAATAIFEMTGGARFIYTGSWCSEGLETSWNSNWRASCPTGTALWDGEGAPAAERVTDADVAAPAVAPQTLPGEGINGSLAAFVHALRTGETPMGECHDNVQSLAMVHAAIASATERRRVEIAELLQS
jgi:predicted dehydrogenase